MLEPEERTHDGSDSRGRTSFLSLKLSEEKTAPIIAYIPNLLLILDKFGPGGTILYQTLAELASLGRNSPLFFLMKMTSKFAD